MKAKVKKRTPKKFAHRADTGHPDLRTKAGRAWKVKQAEKLRRERNRTADRAALLAVAIEHPVFKFGGPGTDLAADTVEAENSFYQQAKAWADPAVKALVNNNLTGGIHDEAISPPSARAAYSRVMV
jgi:hypothetical protein